MQAELRMLRGNCPQNAVFGTAVSSAVLRRVASGELPDTARLGRPARIVTFGRRDAVSPGYGDAVAAARARGYEVVERITGGRATAFNGAALNFSIARRDPDPATGTRARFEEMAALIAEALAGLGVDARIGELPGEYCPGAYSVNAGGRLKLAGIGQRLVKGGVHVGCLIVAAGSEELRAALTPVYEALGLEWDRAAAGSVEDVVPGAGPAEVEEAILAALRARFRLSEAQLDAETAALAEQLQDRHRPGAEA